MGADGPESWQAGGCWQPDGAGLPWCLCSPLAWLDLSPAPLKGQVPGCRFCSSICPHVRVQKACRHLLGLRAGDAAQREGGGAVAPSAGVWPSGPAGSKSPGPPWLQSKATAVHSQAAHTPCCLSRTWGDTPPPESSQLPFCFGTSQPCCLGGGSEWGSGGPLLAFLPALP